MLTISSLQGILLVVVNVGVILSAPIQFIMDRAAKLLETKAKLSTFAAAAALRASQSAIVRQRSRQLFGQDRSQRFPSADQDHIVQGTSELSSQRSSSLIEPKVRPASSAGAESTAHPAAILQAPSNATLEQLDVGEQSTAQHHNQSTSCDGKPPSPGKYIHAQLPMELSGEDVVFVATRFM